MARDQDPPRLYVFVRFLSTPSPSRVLSFWLTPDTTSIAFRLMIAHDVRFGTEVLHFTSRNYSRKRRSEFVVDGKNYISAKLMYQAEMKVSLILMIIPSSLLWWSAFGLLVVPFAHPVKYGLNAKIWKEMNLSRIRPCFKEKSASKEARLFYPLLNLLKY